MFVFVMSHCGRKHTFGIYNKLYNNIYIYIIYIYIYIYNIYIYVYIYIYIYIYIYYIYKSSSSLGSHSVPWLDEGISMPYPS